MQPPGAPPGVPLGQVVAVGGMKASMPNGAFAKWLSMPLAASLQVALSGGEVRLGSFCFRHPNGARPG